MAEATVELTRIKEEFPVLKRVIHGKPVIYLDNAATTQKPQEVIDAITDYYGQHNANPHRSIHTLASEATELYEQARAKVARFINASPEEIVFTAGTTHGLNMLAYMLIRDCRPGDEIVITEMEHHSNLVQWQQLAEDNGLVLKAIKVLPDFTLDMEHARATVGPRTRIVAATHVSNVTGTINPVKELSQLAHSNGALIIVDGAQAAGHMPVDVKELDADFYVFGGHKMYGPMGIGVLYIDARHAALRPAFFGGGMVGNVSLRVEVRTTYGEAPQRFEAGTPDVAGAVGLAAAVRFIERVGIARIRDHEQELVAYAIGRLASLGVNVIGPTSGRGSAVSFVVPGIHPHDVAQVCDAEGIAIRAGHHCAQPLGCALALESSARMSVAVYNTKEDIDALAAAIQKARALFAP